MMQLKKGIIALLFSPIFCGLLFANTDSDHAVKLADRIEKFLKSDPKSRAGFELFAKKSLSTGKDPYFMDPQHYFFGLVDEGDARNRLSESFFKRYLRLNFNRFAVGSPEVKNYLFDKPSSVQDEVARRSTFHRWPIITFLSVWLLATLGPSNSEFATMTALFSFGSFLRTIGLTPAWLRGWGSHLELLSSRWVVDDALQILRQRGFAVPKSKNAARLWLLSFYPQGPLYKWLASDSKAFDFRLRALLFRLRNLTENLLSDGPNQNKEAGEVFLVLYKRMVKLLYPEEVLMGEEENYLPRIRLSGDSKLTKSQNNRRLQIYISSQDAFTEIVKNYKLGVDLNLFKLESPDLFEGANNTSDLEEFEAPEEIRRLFFEEYLIYRESLANRKMKIRIKLGQPSLKVQGTRVFGEPLGDTFFNAPVTFQLIAQGESVEKEIEWNPQHHRPSGFDLSKVHQDQKWREAAKKYFVDHVVLEFGLQETSKPKGLSEGIPSGCRRNLTDVNSARVLDQGEH